METSSVLTRGASRQRGSTAPEKQAQDQPERRRRRQGRRINKDQEEEAVFRDVVNFAPDPLPARYYDKDTTRPISFYLSTLEELLAWTPLMEDGFNVALEPLECRQPPLSSPRPRTLLCHDMMGGYLEDRFIQGSEVQNPYSFYHWQYIDIFVYFSHHTVTIPPVCWTNAAHRHGVCVLGTFITEWQEGGKLCEAFLAGDERSFQAVADRLVQIAQFFRFDGWLINIENSLSPAAVRNTPLFLQYLTRQLHQQVPGGLVLWYDSVVQSGQLKWQDELNEQNRVFFDSCDGFFTNYNWREDHLKRMVAQAGERLADVYVGIDVFARSNVVGGRFDTDKSLELIRKHGFSAALFAPGWVYECLEKNDFFQNQDKFWRLLERFLPTHSICSLPFVTSFCLGLGTRRVCYGKEQAVGPWYHPSAQETQPLFGEHKLAGGNRGWVKTHCCLVDAWHGGSSLLLRGLIPPEVDSVAVRLFSMHVPVPPKVFLSMVYKFEGSTDVQVALELTTGDASSCHVGGVLVLNETGTRYSPRPLRVPPTRLARWASSCGQQLSGGWIQRCYEVNLRGCLLQDLLVSFSRPPGSREEESFICRLGEIQVVDANSLLAPLPRVQNVTISQLRWLPLISGSEGLPTRLLLSCTLHWSYLLPRARCFRIHCWERTGSSSATEESPGTEKPEFLGLAFANQYRVVDLAVEAARFGQDGRVEFLVEPVPREGFLVPQAEWGRAVLLYSAPQ
ncbi:similar to RIKEN cDNA D230014K01 (predicted) [Rattus norvegicus]|uniref:Cytosolic endo-beta-N-acetylglucosaminidase n=2 Tax=Rattus norvegicus TaxID=10116 RepID=A6HL61_RAT|nr:cytosolic endo-beta-N-acetylglucosaminidase [Rattus norvegicus]EDM06766.1 similar to RIKEN cDNA D230014K01 (predicted) [Rattus norvegicus]|eukprot:NP_001100540.1 cytosolic endo-beta-N-acetylglucosaminidase [Rattus norvegicus]